MSINSQGNLCNGCRRVYICNNAGKTDQNLHTKWWSITSLIYIETLFHVYKFWNYQQYDRKNKILRLSYTSSVKASVEIHWCYKKCTPPENPAVYKIYILQRVKLIKGKNTLTYLVTRVSINHYFKRICDLITTEQKRGYFNLFLRNFTSVQLSEFRKSTQLGETQVFLQGLKFWE